jgi:hypothetical protein
MNMLPIYQSRISPAPHQGRESERDLLIRVAREKEQLRRREQRRSMLSRISRRASRAA